MKSIILSGCVLAALLPAAVTAAGAHERLVAVVQAQGAQVYECGTDAADLLDWQLREPVAALLDGGKTVGRHYAGPTWEFADGSAIVGKVVERMPGASPRDIPHLKLEVASRRGSGMLAGVTAIRRTNTQGGVPEGRCKEPGALLSVPYAADYAFYQAERHGQAGFPKSVSMRGPYDYLFRADDNAVATASVVPVATTLDAERHHTVVPGDAIVWGKAPASLPPGAQAALLLGSPAQEGPFVLRLKFPAGFVIPPHMHSKDEFVTVLSGSLTIRAGTTVDRTSLKGQPAGTFMHLPAGMAHYLWAETESVVQLNGVGPFDVKYIDPKDDPRKGS